MFRWISTHHQALTAIGAMIVGAAALFIAWDQARVMRAQQHGSVYPAMQIQPFTSTNNETVALGLRLANNGVGPAFVENVTLTRDGEPVDRLDGMFAAMPEQTIDRSWNNVTGRVFAPGETVVAISIEWESAIVPPTALPALFEEWERWDARVCYCSVFDRCWVATVQTAARERVSACPARTPDLFELYGAEPFLTAAETPGPEANE